MPLGGGEEPAASPPTGCCHSVAQPCPTLKPHGRQHARPPCPSLSPGVCANKLMCIESVMPSNHLILCYSLLLLPSIFPSIRVSSNESGQWGHFVPSSPNWTAVDTDEPALQWRFAVCVNLSRPPDAQILGPTLFWVYLWGFWMRLTLNW